MQARRLGREEVVDVPNVFSQDTTPDFRKGDQVQFQLKNGSSVQTGSLHSRAGKAGGKCSECWNVTLPNGTLLPVDFVWDVSSISLMRKKRRGRNSGMVSHDRRGRARNSNTTSSTCGRGPHNKLSGRAGTASGCLDFN